MSGLKRAFDHFEAIPKNIRWSMSGRSAGGQTVAMVLWKAVAQVDRERDELYKAASDAWDAVKSNPNHPEHDEAWVAFEQAKAPANHGPARRALDAALRQADQNYHAELAELGREHGVSVC